MYNEKLKELEKRIGYTFKDKKLLIRALTHSSYSNEAKARGEETECNERLEFLGDSVLSLIVTTYLFKEYNKSLEGELSKIRSFTVSEKPLSRYASEINLGSYLFLGHGEDNESARRRPSLTSDAFEALIAAIYLDSGIEEAAKFVLPFAIKNIETLEKEKLTVDYKSLLQQIVQQEAGEILEYELLEERGPAHDKEFFVAAKLNNNVIGKGQGKSKRAAEQSAAKEALELFGKSE